MTEEKTGKAPTTKKRTWNDNEDKAVDSTEYDKNDQHTFLNLLEKRETDSENTEIQPGKVIKGKIVSIRDNAVIVDVNMKSEGIIPIEEFTNRNELAVGQEVEVLLNEMVGENGQVSLSREKANRQRKWENILKNCKEGSILKGKIIRKVKGGLIVDLDGIDAFLPGSQISNKRITSVDEYLGQSFNVKIININEKRKNIVVSRREVIESDRICKKAEILENLAPGSICKGTVKNITEFGVFLDLNDIDGLLHITDMTWKRIKHPSELVSIGDELEVVVISVDKEKGRVALGMKQKEPNPWDEIERKYPPGTRVSGKIVNIVPYGAFIEVEDGIEGLIHLSEMSWVKDVTDPNDVVQKGERVDAEVLSVQKAEGKISLGIKQLLRNPWKEIEKKYPVGSKVRVEIRNLVKYGAFVELEPGVDGLIHVSDMSWTKRLNPSEILKKGDEVDAVVRYVDGESKKITLSLKALKENPWDNVEAELPIGKIISGKVLRTASIGMFVGLENDMEGLIRNTDLPDTHPDNVEEKIKINDTIKAKVIKIDKEQYKISLTMKGAGLGLIKNSDLTEE